MASKKKTPAKKPAVAETPAGELTIAERLAAAQRGGNPHAVEQLRAELGLSAPPVYRDALTRTRKKAR